MVGNLAMVREILDKHVVTVLIGSVIRREMSWPRQTRSLSNWVGLLVLVSHCVPNCDG